MGTITVGTSSWADPGFVAEWYPKGMAARDRLTWYAQRFEAVELNSSFYAIPERATVERWVEQTPDSFTFDVKLHRLLSRHSAPIESLPPGLRDDVRTTGRGRVLLDGKIEEAMCDALLDAIEPLEDHGRLSALLLQLSPSFKPGPHDLDELDALLERLAPRKVAVELRHRGWVSGERTRRTLEYLSAHGAAFVCTDMPAAADTDSPTVMPAVDAVTTDTLAYLRLHGRNLEGYLTGRTVAERFAWDYSDGELRELAGRVSELAGIAQDTRVMFNNNRGRDAPVAARRFRELLGQDAGPPGDEDVGGQMTLDA